MKISKLPLKEMSIAEIYNGEEAIYQIPIYQRNYTWGKDEISAFVQDMYDAFISKKPVYYIGTLVTYFKGDHVFEVIDGQQRLTTMYLLLEALDITRSKFPRNRLTYRARMKSDATIRNISNLENVVETDNAIKKGYDYAQEAVRAVVSKAERSDFAKYFWEKVHLIHYQVPKDVDLNHYFEIMNSRGEQLEKHEIIKAELMAKFDTDDPNSADERTKFSRIWEACREMNVYIQQRYRDSESIFGRNLHAFLPACFDDIPFSNKEKAEASVSIIDLLNGEMEEKPGGGDKDKPDTFQPIIDFSNFLLIVLKLTLIENKDFDPAKFNLDDKELLHEFEKGDRRVDAAFVKKFVFNLLKAKYLLDNYVVHHSNEDDVLENNPWKLQWWQRENGNNREKAYLRNISDDTDLQNKLVHLLSMFEVSFTARQRKNYLFYCLFYLFNAGDLDLKKYCGFLLWLAEKYFREVYLEPSKLNEANVPLPGSFDSVVLKDNRFDCSGRGRDIDVRSNFSEVYGTGEVKSKGVPLFIFNYLDYRLWEKYSETLRGEKLKAGGSDRKAFFKSLGCGDFGLEIFEHFYFSRTRRSLEHYYPQKNIMYKDAILTEAQINCLGNYAMIGSEANSRGSNWSPKAKLDHYLDTSKKISQISVASLKFMIMMQICKENVEKRESGQEWNFDDIKDHQKRMIDVLCKRDNI